MSRPPLNKHYKYVIFRLIYEAEDMANIDEVAKLTGSTIM